MDDSQDTELWVVNSQWVHLCNVYVEKNLQLIWLHSTKSQEKQNLEENWDVHQEQVWHGMVGIMGVTNVKTFKWGVYMDAEMHK